MKHWKRFFLSSAIALSFMVTAGCGQSELRDSNALWGQADATEVDINTKVPGRLIKLYVKEGSEVKKGEKLAEIDQREQNALESAAQAKVEAAKAACLQAEANYDQALRDIQRYEMLYQNGAVSKAVYESYSNKRDVMSAVYEQSKASLAASEEAWKQSSINQGETTLVAPFDGIVTTKYSDIGAMISSGMPIVAVQDPVDNWVDFKVKETELDKYPLHARVHMEGRNPQLKIDGVIVDISKKPNFATYRATSERGNDDDIITFSNFLTDRFYLIHYNPPCFAEQNATAIAGAEDFPPCFPKENATAIAGAMPTLGTDFPPCFSDWILVSKGGFQFLTVKLHKVTKRVPTLCNLTIAKL